jgi:hypothetical protein
MEAFLGRAPGADRLRADPQRFVNTTGREIDGLPSSPERFVVLREGSDYKVIEVNSCVRSSSSVAEFVLFASPSAGTEEHVVDAPHWRSITVRGLDAVLHSRKKGDPVLGHYYVANAKGSGFLKPRAEGIDLDQYPSWVARKMNGPDVSVLTLGMASRSDFMRGAGVMADSQYLAGQGLRCEVYWGIFELKQVPFKGEMVPVSRLAKEGVIGNENSAEAVRLFKTNTRVEEALESDERRMKIFQDAFDTFNKETKDMDLPFPQLDITNKDHQEIWFSEFFRRMGRNLAVLVNVGYSHSHLHSSNITMAAEIADLESVWDLRVADRGFKDDHNVDEGGIRRLILKDMRDVAYACRALMKAGRAAGLSVGNSVELAQSLRDGFLSQLKPNDFKKMTVLVRPGVAEYWIDRIMDKAIVRNERLAPLLHGKVSDWGIPNFV